MFRAFRAIAIAGIVGVCSCTTVTRSDGTTVRIPAGGFVGSMAATNIACEDNVKTLLDENAKLRAQVADLQARVDAAKKAQPASAAPQSPQPQP